MIEFECKNCKKKFMGYGDRLYCSKKCAIQSSWENRERAKKITIVCKNCNKEFELNSSETRVKEKKVNYCSRKCRDEAREKKKNVKCKNCGIEFLTTRNKCCSRKCAIEYLKKHYKHKIYKEKGYEVRFINGYNKKGNAKIHRLIMEEHLGRKLNPKEIVHHIDGNKLNNDILNLQVMTWGEHSKLHRKKELENGKKLFKKLI